MQVFPRSKGEACVPRADALYSRGSVLSRVRTARGDTVSKTSSSRRLVTGLAVTALALTATGVAGGAVAQAAPLAAPGPLTNFVVNTRADAGHMKQTERAIEDAGGTVVQS